MLLTNVVIIAASEGDEHNLLYPVVKQLQNIYPRPLVKSDAVYFNNYLGKWFPAPTYVLIFLRSYLKTMQSKTFGSCRVL
jgi:hypothetical protein